MTQARLNHCIILHVLRDRTDQLHDKEVAKSFIERNERVGTTLDSSKCINNNKCVHVINSYV